MLTFVGEHCMNAYKQEGLHCNISISNTVSFKMNVQKSYIILVLFQKQVWRYDVKTGDIKILIQPLSRYIAQWMR